MVKNGQDSFRRIVNAALKCMLVIVSNPLFDYRPLIYTSIIHYSIYRRKSKLIELKRHSSGYRHCRNVDIHLFC